MSSWPGLSRPSTTSVESQSKQDVDARHKAGHDERGMTIEDDIAFLEGIPSLRLLGRDALRILAIGAESREIHEGISLFGEGEDADCAYVVQEGSFELVAETSA